MAERPVLYSTGLHLISDGKGVRRNRQGAQRPRPWKMHPNRSGHAKALGRRQARERDFVQGEGPARVSQ